MGRRQLSRHLHLLWRGMRRSRAHAVAVAVAFAARCRRVLRGVWKEEEEAVQGEARGKLRLPEEGEAVPRHAAERGHVLELRQEEALQARRGVLVVRLEEEGQLRTGVGAGVGAGLISL